MIPQFIVISFELFFNIHTENKLINASRVKKPPDAICITRNLTEMISSSVSFKIVSIVVFVSDSTLFKTVDDSDCDGDDERKSFTHKTIRDLMSFSMRPWKNK